MEKYKTFDEMFNDDGIVSIKLREEIKKLL